MLRYKLVDWNNITEQGLLRRINKDIMHPLGLAIVRDVETGKSPGAIILSEGRWEPSEDVAIRVVQGELF